MNEAFENILGEAPALRRYAEEADYEVAIERMVRAYGAASSGERVMIAAALSLLPEAWLPDHIKAPPFRLSDAGSLDADNTHALLEAIAIQAGHPGLV